MISKDFINDLLSRIDVATVIGSRIELKRAGSNLVGLCPFHNEKSPSFTVSQPKQFYHCFGCNASGNAISFLMQFERLEFVEAVENLATLAGLVVPKVLTNQRAEAQHANLYPVTSKVAQFFAQELKVSPTAVAYLKARGLTGAICKQFGIGYAPENNRLFLEKLRRIGLRKEALMQIGVLGEKNSYLYSRLRGRITFPILNVRGEIVGFGGRTITNDPAKYINSPETAIFHKGSELYGLYQAKKASKLDAIIVVEGYLDVLSLVQFGITNVVATLGTAVSQRQIQMMLRYTSKIIFCFDGDAAGRAAAWRALEVSLLVLRDGLDLRFLFLPEGFDPDRLIRTETRELFLQRLADASLTLDAFFIRHLLEKIDINTIEGKAKLVKMSQDLLKSMPQGIFKTLLNSKVAELVGVNLEELQTYHAPMYTEPNTYGVKTPEMAVPKVLPVPLERLLAIFLHHPQIVFEIDNFENVRYNQIGGFSLLSELLALIKEHKDITTGAILEHWRESADRELWNRLVRGVPIVPTKDLRNEIESNLQALSRINDERELELLLEKASRGGIDDVGRKRLQELIIRIKQ